MDDTALTVAEQDLIESLVRDHRGGVPFVPLDFTGRPIAGGEAPRAELRVRVADWPLLRALWAEQGGQGDGWRRVRRGAGWSGGAGGLRTGASARWGAYGRSCLR